MTSSWEVFEPKTPEIVLATVIFEDGVEGDTGSVIIKASDDPAP